MYDLVIGGAGLFGATLAYYMKKKGRKVLVLEKNEIGGLCGDTPGYSKYGIHIFHTNDPFLWAFVNKIAPFDPVHYSPLVMYKDEMYSFPINLLTLHQLGFPEVIKDVEGDSFEDVCIKSMGKVIYEKFFYHYTKKMWDCEPRLLPASILKRIPVRTDYNTSYYDDKFVGVPRFGYTDFILNLLNGIEVRFDDFVNEHRKYDCKKVFTGSIDDFYRHCHGELTYRGMEFETVQDTPALAINYTDDRPYVREINYKYLGGDRTIRETPSDKGRFYPVPWGKTLYQKYADIETDVIFAGRLGTYQYINMNEVMERAWQTAQVL